MTVSKLIDEKGKTLVLEQSKEKDYTILGVGNWEAYAEIWLTKAEVEKLIAKLISC